MTSIVPEPSSDFTLHSAALWNSQQTFFEYMRDTGRSREAESIRHLLTPVDKRDDKCMPVQCMVDDVGHMVRLAPEPTMAVQMVLRNKAVLLPLFTALRAWSSTSGLPSEQAPVPLFLFIQLCTRYWGLNNEIASFDVVRSNGFIEVTLTPSDKAVFHTVIGEGMATGLVMAVRNFIGTMPAYIGFPDDKPTEYSVDEYCQVLGMVPEFSQPSVIIKYPDEQFDFEISGPVIDILGHLNCLHARQFPDVCFVQRIRWIMEQLLPITEPTKHLVAKVMNTSVSTLERRLKYADTSFKTILLGLKKQLAFEYLVKLNKSASKTSMLLGYTSSSQFFKAFKQWFGQTPKEFKASYELTL